MKLLLQAIAGGLGGVLAGMLGGVIGGGIDGYLNMLGSITGGQGRMALARMGAEESLRTSATAGLLVGIIVGSTGSWVIGSIVAVGILIGALVLAGALEENPVGFVGAALGGAVLGIFGGHAGRLITDAIWKRF